MEKECRECFTVKPLSDFYKCAKMFDGHFNKCKECAKAKVTAHRNKNIEAVREYDRKRSKQPHRLKANRDNSKQYRDSGRHGVVNKKYRDDNPEKYRAHNILNNAIRDGKIKKPYKCEVCDKRRTLHGHHDDYSKPLDVDWLCAQCHNGRHENLD